jgi:hypothetical protein
VKPAANIPIKYAIAVHVADGRAVIFAGLACAGSVSENSRWKGKSPAS